MQDIKMADQFAGCEIAGHTFVNFVINQYQ